MSWLYSQAPQELNGALNPVWVEWLMGWPQGWTDLRPLATDKCRNAQRRHGGF
jgi:DNA (cytosine-5)-methyltransferase 1